MGIQNGPGPHDRSSSRLFLSYGRRDDEPFVARLAKSLADSGHTVWFDRDAMASRGRPFRQELRDAITAADRVILVLGPAAAVSPQVEAEWRLALGLCKVVVPVLRIGDNGVVPAELASLHRIDAREPRPEPKILSELDRVLRDPVPPLGRLVNADPLPEHFVPRPQDLWLIERHLLADLREPVVIVSAGRTTALQGMGGMGKSLLASAFSRSCAARRAFGDGIVWIRLGQAPDIHAAVRHLASVLGEVAPNSYENLDRARARLADVLAERVCLLVMDDVWGAADVEPFLPAMGPHCRMLITTRAGSLVTAIGAREIALDVLTEQQAKDLLAAWLSVPSTALPAGASDLVRECGNLPFAIALAGAMARDGQPMADLIEAMRSAELSFLEQRLPNYPYPDLLRCMGASLDFLGRRDESGRRRYLELSVFPDGAEVPEAAVHALWGRDGAMRRQDTAKLLVKLERSGLLQLTGAAGERRIRLHDIQHDYLRAMADDPREGHVRLLSGYRRLCPKGWATGPDDGYFFQFLGHHLFAAGSGFELAGLLGDGAWLEAQLVAAGVAATAGDFDRVQGRRGVAADLALPAARQAIIQSTDVLTRHPEQVTAQLTARLRALSHPGTAEYLTALASSTWRPWLQAVCQALPGPATPISWLAHPDNAVHTLEVDHVAGVVRTTDQFGAACYWRQPSGGRLLPSDVPDMLLGPSVTAWRETPRFVGLT